jgi:glycosyltransferase involved in cell wall biosynthesis
MARKEKDLNVEYNFSPRHNRFETNVAEERELPILVLKEPIYDEDGKLVQRGILYCGDYIVDDFVAAYPNIKDEWFLVSTTQSHVVPKNVAPDLHLYSTDDGQPAQEYLESTAGEIPCIIMGCGHFVDSEVFYPTEQEKEYDLIYVAKWAPTKRIENILEAAKLDPSLNILIVSFPVVSERKRAQSDAYREQILGMKEDLGLDNVTIIEPPTENHVNEDGSFVVGGFSKEEMNSFYNMAKMTILAADSGEGINRSLGEAMCCDLPVLLTKDTWGGVQTLVNEQTGVRVGADPVEIAAAINFVRDNRDRFSPRDWFAGNYGKDNANRILMEKIREIAQQQESPIDTEGMKPYGGDVWSKTDFYEHIGKKK